ncbi:MAG: ADP-ribosyltransferase [Acutalibacteraceae bacterium]|nr:ADP-ribosyltransferase [Acutalibacteraceae bacterium]
MIFQKCKYGKLLESNIDKSLYREFKDKNETREWGKNIYSSWSNEYKRVMGIVGHYKGDTSNSLFNSPIEFYCGHSHLHINNYMRGIGPDHNGIYRELSDIIKILLISAPRIPENIVLYRVVCDDFINEMIKLNKETNNTPVCEKGFISTSLLTDIVDLDEAYNNYDNLLKIYVDKGTVGLYVNCITNRAEEEILLMSNGYFRMIEYPYRDEETNKMIYECKLLTPDITMYDMIYTNNQK